LFQFVVAPASQVFPFVPPQTRFAAVPLTVMVIEPGLLVVLNVTACLKSAPPNARFDAFPVAIPTVPETSV